MAGLLRTGAALRIFVRPRTFQGCYGVGMTNRKLKFWGWGREGEGPDEAATRKIAAALARRFAMEAIEVIAPPRIEELDLRAPRFERPESLRAMLTDDASERARHTHGRSYRDLVRAFRRDFSEPPDWVAFPENERAVIDLAPSFWLEMAAPGMMGTPNHMS